jgi:hypothetical protein
MQPAVSEASQQGGVGEGHAPLKASAALATWVFFRFE